MKIGMRKPSIKKSISARTTGKLKRTIKKTVNPLYGKKGMGVINNPKKALYNKVYNKTTFGVKDITNKFSSKQTTYKSTLNQNHAMYPYSSKTYSIIGSILLICAWIIGISGLFILPTGLIFIGAAILFAFAGRKYKNVAKAKDEPFQSENTETSSEE